MTWTTIFRGAFLQTRFIAPIIVLAIAGAHPLLAPPLAAQDVRFAPPVDGPYFDVEVDEYMQDENFERRFLGTDVDFRVNGIPADEYWEHGLPDIDVDIQEYWEREGLDYIDRDPSDLYDYVGDEHRRAFWPPDDVLEEEYYGGDYYEDEFYRESPYAEEYLDAYDDLDEPYLDNPYLDNPYLDNPYLDEPYVDENLWDGPSIYIDRTGDDGDFLPDSYGYPYGLAHPHTPVMIREDLQRSVVDYYTDDRIGDYYTDDWYDRSAYFDRWYAARRARRPEIEFEDEVGDVDVDVEFDR